MKQEIKAIIFDMDGVIIDSMPAHARTWLKALKKHEIEATKSDIFRMEGYKNEEIIQDLSEREVSLDEMKEIGRIKHEYFKQEEVELFPVQDLLEKLGEKYRLGIVTGGTRAEVNHNLSQEILSHLDVILSEEDYQRGKPYPEPFLKGIEKFNLSKENLLVVENAPAGVESAKEAGLTVLAIATYVDKEELDQADFVVENHQELSDFLSNHFLSE